MNPVAELNILDASRDAAAWDQLISGLGFRYQDPFLLSGYARVYEKVYGGKAGLFHFKKGNSFGFQIFLRRPVNELPFYKIAAGDRRLFDIITPEYAGPVIVCSDNEKSAFLQIFWEEFSEFCRREGIVAEFGRLNPYYNNDPEFLTFVQAQPNRQIVWLDLSLEEKELWQGFSKGNKSSIKKAQKTGIVVKKTDNFSDVVEFYRVYAQTMERNQAARFYYFSPDFFHDLFSQLKGSISLFTAVYKEKIVAASVFLHKQEYLHYYFSGSDSSSLDLCPNNLLIFTVIQWAKKEGYKVFSLGGGYHNNGQDSLFKFKSSFSQLRRDFFVYRRIHDAGAYDSLCSAFRDYHGLPSQVDKAESYFPFYRMIP